MQSSGSYTSVPWLILLRKDGWIDSSCCKLAKPTCAHNTTNYMCTPTAYTTAKNQKNRTIVIRGSKSPAEPSFGFEHVKYSPHNEHHAKTVARNSTWMATMLVMTLANNSCFYPGTNHRSAYPPQESFNCKRYAEEHVLYTGPECHHLFCLWSSLHMHFRRSLFFRKLEVHSGVMQATLTVSKLFLLPWLLPAPLASAPPPPPPTAITAAAAAAQAAAMVCHHPPACPPKY